MSDPTAEAPSKPAGAEPPAADPRAAELLAAYERGDHLELRRLIDGLGEVPGELAPVVTQLERRAGVDPVHALLLLACLGLLLAVGTTYAG